MRYPAEIGFPKDPKAGRLERASILVERWQIASSFAFDQAIANSAAEGGKFVVHVNHDASTAGREEAENFLHTFVLISQAMTVAYGIDA